MEGLKNNYEFVTNNRDAVRYIKSLPSRFVNFKTCVVNEKISERMICLDVLTR